MSESKNFDNFKARSAFSQEIDPYLAGVDIASQMNDIQPQIIFLFTTIHYDYTISRDDNKRLFIKEEKEDMEYFTKEKIDILQQKIYYEKENNIGSEKILDGIKDYAKTWGRKPKIIGCTGYGTFYDDKSYEFGTSALGVYCKDMISHIKHSEFNKDNVKKVSKKLFNDIKKDFKNDLINDEKPDIFFIITDFRPFGVIDKIVNENNIPLEYRDIPIIGGSAGDSYNIRRCYQYCDFKRYTNNIVLLGIKGNINFQTIYNNDVKEHEDKVLNVTKDIKTNEYLINENSIWNFIETKLGKPMLQVDRGMIGLRKYENNTNDQQINISLVPDDRYLIKYNQHKLLPFSNISEGEYKLYTINREVLKDSLYTINKNIKQNDIHMNSNSKGILLISCSGRKEVWGEKYDKECKTFYDGVSISNDGNKNLAGFSSFGEFFQMKHKNKNENVFSNMATVSVIISGRD